METHYKTSNGHQRVLVPWLLKKAYRVSEGDKHPVYPTLIMGYGILSAMRSE